jgi:hypothetical protein
LAYPQLVADNLGLECVNLGEPGASNKYIAHTIPATELTNTDIVTVMWTQADRYCIERSPGNFTHIAQWLFHKQLASKMYYKHLYSKYDSYVQFVMQKHFSLQYLRSKVKHVIHLSAVSYHYVDIDHPKNQSFEWDTEKYELVFDEIRKGNFPKALDDSHPGKEAHKAFAVRLGNYIRDKYVI